MNHPHLFFNLKAFGSYYRIDQRYCYLSQFRLKIALRLRRKPAKIRRFRTRFRPILNRNCYTIRAVAGLVEYSAVAVLILATFNDFSNLSDNSALRNTCFYMLGTHIPILDKRQISVTKPDYIVILPWNLSAEIEEEVIESRTWGCKLITFIPEAKIF